MWRDTGNSRYLADTLRRNPLPLTDGRRPDPQGVCQGGRTTSDLKGSGKCGVSGHDANVSDAYFNVNEALIAQHVSQPYNFGMRQKKGPPTVLSQLCADRGWDQTRFAKEMGIEPAAVSQWANGGGVSMQNATAAAKLLNTTVDRIIDGKKLRLATNDTIGRRNVNNNEKNLTIEGDSGDKLGNNAPAGNQGSLPVEGNSMPTTLERLVYQLQDDLERVRKEVDELKAHAPERAARPRKGR